MRETVGRSVALEIFFQFAVYLLWSPNHDIEVNHLTLYFWKCHLNKDFSFWTIMTAEQNVQLFLSLKNIHELYCPRSIDNSSSQSGQILPRFGSDFQLLNYIILPTDLILFLFWLSFPGSPQMPQVWHRSSSWCCPNQYRHYWNQHSPQDTCKFGTLFFFLLQW